MTARSGQPSHGQKSSLPAQNTVNNALTPKRRRPVTENSDYAVFARRILRAYSRRIATGDVESLTDLINLADDINDAIQEAAEGLRVVGYSWAEIGARVGITRQAAQQRWSITPKESRVQSPKGSFTKEVRKIACECRLVHVRSCQADNYTAVSLICYLKTLVPTSSSEPAA